MHPAFPQQSPYTTERNQHNILFIDKDFSLKRLLILQPFLLSVDMIECSTLHMYLHYRTATVNSGWGNTQTRTAVINDYRDTNKKPAVVINSLNSNTKSLSRSTSCCQLELNLRLLFLVQYYHYISHEQALWMLATETRAVLQYILWSGQVPRSPFSIPRSGLIGLHPVKASVLALNWMFYDQN